MTPFTPLSTSKLTSTSSSQTVTVPVGASVLVAYNGGPQPVYLKYGASVAVPGAWAEKVMAVQPYPTQAFAVPQGGGTLAYIADTTGGSLVLSVGEGL